MLLTDDLRMEITGESNADIVIDVYNASEDLTEVKLSGNRGYIKYGGGRARLFRGIGLICEALEHGKTEFYKKEKPNFITNGPMIDVSRNAVLRPGIVKAAMRKIALMGLNMFMLYTEDTYEIENRPYFGHMRAGIRVKKSGIWTNTRKTRYRACPVYSNPVASGNGAGAELYGEIQGHP